MAVKEYKKYNFVICCSGTKTKCFFSEDKI